MAGDQLGRVAWRELGQDAVDGVLAGSTHQADVAFDHRAALYWRGVGSVPATWFAVIAPSIATQGAVWSRKWRL